MSKRHLPTLRCPAAAVLLVALCAAVSPLAAQQAADTVVTDTTSVQANPVSTSLPGPQLPPYVQSVRPVDARVTERGVAPLAAQGGQHTIVISTLALVLAVVIIVLLVK